MKRRFSTGTLLACGLAAMLTATSAPAGEVILQYFEGKWETIERRAPDIFMAGYDAVWVPPPGKADSGGYSVGYDVFDRFNLGTPGDRTLYGTEQGFHRMSEELDRAGMSLFIDTVLNHNGFRDASTTDFEAYGGYPGFVTTLPEDIDGDFHSSYAGGDIEGRLAGLIDIAQEKNHRFIRNPVPGFSNLIPNETPRESNRALYPDLDLPEEYGRHPFNLASPLAGDPVEENATGLLQRYCQWISEVHGVDGYRLDAVKHVPTWFWNGYFDPAVYNVGRNPIDGLARTPFSFGENFTGDFGLLAAYCRKDGYGNRDTLDFPLFFAMKGVFDAGGFGDMRNLEYASFDGVDGNANDGTFGVLFAASHDEFGPGKFNGFDNIPHAHILTRTGYPAVYYNAHEFGTNRDFPKDGRGDAIGNYGVTLLPTLVRINDVYSRSGHNTRWIDEDIYIYERWNSMLVGLSDRGDDGYDERTVQTAFGAGTVLTELTGNATDATVDPGDDLFDTVTVNGDGTVTIRVPRNSSNGTQHGRGYVVYGPATPASTLVVTNEASVIPPDSASKEPECTKRLTPLHVVTDDTIDVELTVVTTAQTPSDNALIKVNFGEVDVDGDNSRNPNGEFAGFESFQNHTEDAGTHTYTASIDATGLQEGYTYLETAAFLQRSEGLPTLFNNQRMVVCLDRLPPEQSLTYPGQTGTADITSADYEAVISTDHTVTDVRVIKNPGAGATDEDLYNQAIANSSTQAWHHDRLEYRYLLSGLVNGSLELAVVAIEETGNYSVQRYTNIDVEIAEPEMALGVDVDTSSGSVNFQGMPGSISVPAYENDIVVRVKPQANGQPISFPSDFTVSLQVDDGDVMMAVPYNPSLLPPVGRLVQNDQNLGDEFDEYRFVWRGYSTGSHTFRATAQLTAGGSQPNVAIGTINVSESTSGPAVTIISPTPGSTASAPATITVEAQFDDNAASGAKVFFEPASGSNSFLLGTVSSNTPKTFSVSRAASSFTSGDTIPGDSVPVSEGLYNIRVEASTGPNGTGIVGTAESDLTIEGLPAFPQLPVVKIDGDADDVLTHAPAIAVSMADGPNGDASPLDFGADGTLTELRALVRDQSLFMALRGDMFGETGTENNDNASLLLVDTAFGSGNGATNLVNDLTDTQDGLRTTVSSAAFSLATDLVTGGGGFDTMVAITQPDIGVGYGLGTDGVEGAFDNLKYQSTVQVSYDDAAGAPAAAVGTSHAGSDAVEVRFPLSDLGNPDIHAMRFAAVTLSDSGYSSPNTLPENAGDSFEATPNAQVLDALAQIPAAADIVINEVFVGDSDWVELYNGTGAAVDISGWSLRVTDQAGVTTYYFIPPGTTIADGAYLVLSDDGMFTPQVPPAGELAVGFNIPWDESRGGAVALLDLFGVGVDYVVWRDADDEPSSDFGSAPYGTAFAGTIAGPTSSTFGHSLARDASSTDTDAASDWDALSGVDAIFPTRGAQNSTPPIDSNGWLLY
ncbi:lamin tail domain-containing protein [bacterium]|nr:lamin tail domain-containing protein [bacterium]